jgi:hypothetical protein
MFAGVLLCQGRNHINIGNSCGGIKSASESGLREGSFI